MGPCGMGPQVKPAYYVMVNQQTNKPAAKPAAKAAPTKPAAPAAPAAVALPPAKVVLVPTGNRGVAVHTQVGAWLHLTVQGAAGSGRPATYTVQVPSTAHKVGVACTVSVGPAALMWLGQNPSGTPQQLTVQPVASPGGGAPAAHVAWRHTANGYLCNIYPQGYNGCAVHTLPAATGGPQPPAVQ